MGLIRQSLPPGFRFHPTDEELLVHYLVRKIKGLKIPEGIIGVIDIYKHEPWDLPDQAVLQSRDSEWYFFTNADRKHTTSYSRTSRITARGFWKATGKDRNVFSGKSCVGVKKSLVFYIGRVPNGERTDWVMYEYRIDEDLEKSIPNALPIVLCRIRRKGGLGPRNGEQYGAPVMGEVDELDSQSIVYLSGILGPQPPVMVSHNAGNISVPITSPKQESDDSNAPLYHVGNKTSHVQEPLSFSHIAVVPAHKPQHVENDERDVSIGKYSSIPDVTQFEHHMVDPFHSKDVVDHKNTLQFPSLGCVGDTTEAFHDLVHPASEEKAVVEELLDQISGECSSSDPMNHLEFLQPALDKTWYFEEAAPLQTLSEGSGVSRWVNGDINDGPWENYLELEDLEVPIDDLFPPMSEIETQEEELAVDGWFQRRTHQNLNLKEPLALGSIAQRIRMKVPAPPVSLANFGAAKHQDVSGGSIYKGSSETMPLSGKVYAAVPEGDSTNSFGSVGSSDEIQLMAHHIFSDVQSSSQAPSGPSKLSSNMSSNKPAFAHKGSDELKHFDGIMFECLPMQAASSLEPVTSVGLRESLQITTGQLQGGAVPGKSAYTISSFHKEACKFQRGGLRVFFRVATAVLLFACLIQGYWKLTVSILPIL